MDELTAKKIENAKRVLEDGHCLWINCNECVANINGCSAIIDSPEGRKFFEDKIKEYGESAQEEKTEITCHNCCAC